MNKYELAVVINGRVNEEEKEKTVENVKGLIVRYDGIISNTDNWGKRRLVYEIQNVREGFYYFITFTAESNVPAQIESRLRTIEDVLRFLIVRVEE